MKYCVVITTAHPDYKRPYTSTYVKFFDNLEKAKSYIKQNKIEYYRDFGVIDSDTDINEENIDDYDDRAYDIIYSDSYMENEPFDGSIYDVRTGNNLTLR